MPIYSYTCTSCNAMIEKRQSFSDAPLTVCDACGGSLRKVIHPVGIVFKGSGWYVTDSRKSSTSTVSDSSESRGKSESSSTSSNGESSSSKSESTSSTSEKSSTPAATSGASSSSSSSS